MAEHTLGEATDSLLPEILLRSGETPVLLYASTSWCAPCKPYAPRVHAYVEAHPGLPAYHVDGDTADLILDRFGVVSFPTTLLVRNGRAGWLREGALGADDLRSQLDRARADLEGWETEAAGDGTTPGTHVELEVPTLPRGSEIAVFTPGIGPRTLGAGEVLSSEDEEELLLNVTADDPFTDRPDTSWVGTLPTGITWGSVSLSGRSIGPEALTPLAGHRILELRLSAEAPLSDAAIPALAGLDVRSIRLDLPDDPERLRAAIPAVRIDGALGGPVGAPTERRRPPHEGWSTPDLLRARIADGERLVALVEPRHLAGSPRGPWIDELTAVSEVPVLAVSSHADRGLTRDLAMSGPAPVVIGADGGRILWRFELTPGESVRDAEDRITRAWATASATDAPALGIPSLRRSSPTTFTPAPGSSLYIGLAAPDAVEVRTVQVTEPLTVPAGWRVSLWQQILDDGPVDLGALARGPLDAVELDIADGAVPDLSPLAEVAGLSELVLVHEDPIDGLGEALGRLTTVRSLRRRGQLDSALLYPIPPSVSVLDGAWGAARV